MRSRALAAAIGVAMSSVSCSVRADDGKAQEKPYLLTPAANPSPVTTGKPCQYQLSIAPKAPWTLKPSTPLKVQLVASSGIKLEKSSLNWQDVVDAKSDAKAVTTGCEGASAGAQKVAAEVSFFLCTEEICQRHVDKVELAVPVQ